MIHVVAIVTARPGRRAEVLEAFHAIVPAVRAEAGCIEYEPVVDAEGAGSTRTPASPDTFLVVEKWETLDALQAHSAAPHMAGYAAAVDGLIVASAVHVLTAAPA